SEALIQTEAEKKLAERDPNDIIIIGQLASLNSQNRRVESYTLESALLSALSFSSFLAIIVSDPQAKDALASVFSPTVTAYVLPRIPFIEGVGSVSLPAPNYISDNKIGLICLALLLCATTFLAVLVARLQFYDRYRDAETVLKAAETFEKKEEDARRKSEQ